MEAKIDESVHSTTRWDIVLRRDLVDASKMLLEDGGATTITTGQVAELVDQGRFAALGKMQGTF